MSAWTSSSLFSCNFVAELSFFFHISLSRAFLHHISMRLQSSSRNSSIIFHPLSFFHICHQCAISQAFFSRCHLHSAHNSCEPSSSLSSQPFVVFPCCTARALVVPALFQACLPSFRIQCRRRARFADANQSVPDSCRPPGRLVPSLQRSRNSVSYAVNNWYSNLAYARQRQDEAHSNTISQNLVTGESGVSLLSIRPTGRPLLGCWLTGRCEAKRSARDKQFRKCGDCFKWPGTLEFVSKMQLLRLYCRP